ncbi:unnamed protein product [Penicillium viridicatum]
MSHQSEYVEVEIEEIQSSSHRSANAAPLILFHDGGGTVFSYYLLGDLNRDVYGIADPYFATINSWTGGIRQMAEAYASSIWDEFTQRPVLLGGWSLGGILCIEVARVMRAKFDASVVGLILLDTPYPGDWKALRSSTAVVSSDLPAKVSPVIRKHIMRRYEEAERLVENWQIPTELAVIRGTEGRPLVNMPPALLVRASDRVPVADDATFAVVDIHRHDRMLGWECCRHEWIREVVDINANHYNIFDDSNKVSDPM